MKLQPSLLPLALAGVLQGCSAETSNDLMGNQTPAEKSAAQFLKQESGRPYVCQENAEAVTGYEIEDISGRRGKVQQVLHCESQHAPTIWCDMDVYVDEQNQAIRKELDC